MSYVAAIIKEGQLFGMKVTEDKDKEVATKKAVDMVWDMYQKHYDETDEEGYIVLEESAPNEAWTKRRLQIDLDEVIELKEQLTNRLTR